MYAHVCQYICGLCILSSALSSQPPSTIQAVSAVYRRPRSFTWAIMLSHCFFYQNIFNWLCRRQKAHAGRGGCMSLSCVNLAQETGPSALFLSAALVCLRERPCSLLCCALALAFSFSDASGSLSTESRQREREGLCQREPQDTEACCVSIQPPLNRSLKLALELFCTQGNIARLGSK